MCRYVFLFLLGCTAQQCWAQTSFDDIGCSDSKPLMYVLYGDKARLSSFGTAKGYPIIARLANLDSDIVGWTARVVGWMFIVCECWCEGDSNFLLNIELQVSEESQHAGKTYFVNFKNGVWHESVAKILESILEICEFGRSMECGDACIRHLLARLLILAADYEEQWVDKS